MLDTRHHPNSEPMADLPPILPTARGRRRHGDHPFDSCVLAASSIYYAKPPSPFSSSSSSAANILRDVSLTARPGELLAVVGPSGAGKSTLLDILAGRTSPSSGHVLLNSSRLRPSCIRRLSAHLPQHDQCHVPHLTVSESFHLTARLVASSSDPSSLLSDLRLTHLADSLIPGSLSGGELRRVSLGLALLRRPAVLILDEPTSGLDSSSALLVLHSLRELTASSHRRPPVVLSIHQPSSLLLSSIDSFLLLSQGVVLHHGDLPSLSSFLASHGLPRSPDLNPLELALQFLPLLVPPTADGATRSPAPALAACLLSYPSPRAREISVLHARSWKTIRRSRRLLLANALEAVLVGLLLGTLYVGAGRDAARGVEKRLGFFAFTLTFLLSSTTEALPTFITERPAILREASAGIYRLSSHLVASTLVFVPCLFVVALLYSSAVYFLVGLCPAWTAFAGFVAVIWALALAANSFVLFVSAVAPDYIAGTSVVTLALAAFFLFSGYFIRKERMPRYWLFMHYLSPYRYALDAMLENEYGCGARQCLAWEAGGTACRLTGRDVLAERGLTAGSKWVGFQVLLVFFVLYRVLYLLVLMRRVARCKR